MPVCTPFEIPRGSPEQLILGHGISEVWYRWARYRWAWYRWVGKPEIGETKLCKLRGRAHGSNQKICINGPRPSQAKLCIHNWVKQWKKASKRWWISLKHSDWKGTAPNPTVSEYIRAYVSVFFRVYFSMYIIPFCGLIIWKIARRTTGAKVSNLLQFSNKCLASL